MYLDALFLIIMLLGLLFYSSQVQQGKIYKLRRIAALEVIDDAVGRATEMGRPILFSAVEVAFLTTGDNGAQTISAMSILDHIAGLCARNNCRLISVVGGNKEKGSEMIPYYQDVVQSAYIREGKGSNYNPEDIRFFGTDQGAMVVGVWEITYVENPAASIFVGAWAAAAMVVLMAASRTEQLIISGTARTSQLPIMAVYSDYLLIGEEIYAAGAKLSNDPRLIGTVVVQDLLKYITMALISIGVILYNAGFKSIVDLISL
jgi:hypothetical protein